MRRAVVVCSKTTKPAIILEKNPDLGQMFRWIEIKALASTLEKPCFLTWQNVRKLYKLSTEK